MTRLARLALLAAALAAPSLASAQERVLDDFTNPAAWKVSATDDVKAALRSVDGPHGKALCLDYDFGRVTGYVTAQRALPLEVPARYEFAVGVRGDGARNAFQFKLVDAGGDNVWWVNKPEFRFPAEWQSLKLRQRDVQFAWGPATDRTLRRTASVEFVIASGSGAGRGSACFDRLVLRRLPDTPPPIPAPVLSADGLGADFGVAREFGALALRWRGAPPPRYAIELSDDGAQWQRVREIDGARGALHSHFLPDSEARYLRIVVPAGVARGAALAAVEPRDAPDANTFFAQLAHAAPRGAYPRAYVGEQSYWTVLGVDGARTASLLGEDGVLEPRPGVGALEPLLVDGDRVLGWADAIATHALRDGDLPMPQVQWRFGGASLALDIEAFGAGTPEAPFAVARYTVRNLGRTPRRVALALAWRPFQANPPTQFLAHPGGASPIASLAWDGHALAAEGALRLRPLTAPSAVRLAPLAAGPAADWLRGPAASAAEPARVDDAAGFASAVLRYDWRLAPGEQREVAVMLPADDAAAAAPAPWSTPAEIAAEQARVAAQWRERLDRVRISGPGEVADVARTLRSALGHILVNRSGPALQPGARAYARSWIRDGALTSSALLRLGHERAARDFLQWFAPFQFKNGKVPCCATVRGADPVPENDSDGEFAFAAADLWRYTRDEPTARALWPAVRAALAHQEALRQSERGEANRAPARAAYFGLMPPSISHEGYSDKPAYSYWDDFWAAIGWRSGVELASALGFADDAARLSAQRREFEADLLASLAASTRRFGLGVLPGAADRGDVDPTSSTVALSPGGLLGTLPEPLVRATFERYWRDFEARRADEAAGRPHGDGAYTPYEWRNVGALVRLGERERAQQAMAYFYRDRRPAGWNQWAEVVARQPRAPRFLGDMPHGWVASDQIRAVLDLFAFEHESRGALVLAAGVPLAWLDGEGLRLDGLRTPYGRLNWRARVRHEGGGHVATFELEALRDPPPGGIELRGPWPRDARVSVDGRARSGAADAIALGADGARVRVEWR